MPIPSSYCPPTVPLGLESLADMALDLRWSWNHAADELWRQVDPLLWERTGNPWLILQTVSEDHLKQLAGDPAFRKALDESVAEYRQARQAQTWFQQAHPEDGFSVAYFSMEYGLGEALPLYSGGLGILAGDYLKTASDLGVPAIGVGLLYQRGYFRQVIGQDGGQTEFNPYNDPSQIPVAPVRNKSGEWLRIKIELPGREVWLRCWEAVVGRVRLYLLDSNDPVNYPPDRGITGELYGGGLETRLQQEIVLGIGGWRMLEALHFDPELCHLNEGHAAFAVLERASSFSRKHAQPFEVGLAATRPGNVFTTHTPVEAGFDRFPPQMIALYLGDYAARAGTKIQHILSLGRRDGASDSEPFNMAYLATRGSGVVNAVSRLHSEVSRRIFQPLYPRWPNREVPVTYVTNGVHMPSWDSATADEVWTSACGKDRWMSTMGCIIERFSEVSDETLWELRMSQTRQLVSYIANRLRRQLVSSGASDELVEECGRLLDPNVLTIGFARRFTGYKRPNLLLKDPARLDRILNNHLCPVQLVIAGKAHPQDEEGRALVREWWHYAVRPEVRGRVVFLADYDMSLAGQLVQGVDLWINTPRRPWEACGTSGMKVLVNGGLNLSELDGWWAEAYGPGSGWAIGDRQEHDEDPEWDAREASQVYELLEKEIVPRFYDRDTQGIPRGWVAMMRNSMAELTPQFSANRMVREYVDNVYYPCVKNYRRRTANGAAEAVLLAQWHKTISRNWHKVRFGTMSVKKQEDTFTIEVVVYADDIETSALQVELYADPTGEWGPETHLMGLVGPVPRSVNGFLYSVQIQTQRPITHYTPRIIPRMQGASVPLEANKILWFQA